MNTTTKTLIGIFGGFIIGGAIYFAYSKWSKSHKKIKNKEQDKDDLDYQENVNFLWRITTEWEDEIKHIIALKYYEYITTPDSPEHHTEQYITEQIKACANLVKFVVWKKATKERDIDIYKFVELFEEAISHPSMQIIYSPHLEAIEWICHKQIPKYINFKQWDIDFDAYFTFLEILYKEFRYNIYHKVQKFLSEATIPVDQLQLEKHIFDDKELSILKDSLWLKLNMPKVDGMNSNTLISNINSNCYLHDIERAKRIKDIQNSHLIEIKKIITERIKVPDFENRKENPADEFIAQFKEYPFKTIKEELVNG